MLLKEAWFEGFMVFNPYIHLEFCREAAIAQTCSMETMEEDKCKITENHWIK